MDLVYSLSFYLVLSLNFSTLLAYIEKEGQRSVLFSSYLAENQFVSHLSFFIHLSSSFVPFCLKNPCLLYSQISYYKEVTFLMKSYKCIIIEMRTEKPCAHSIMGVSTFHGMHQRLHSHMVININILVVHRYGYINIHETLELQRYITGWCQFSYIYRG